MNLAPPLSSLHQDHDFHHLDASSGGWRLVCDCGWTTELAHSAEAIGTEWDVHRAQVGSAAVPSGVRAMHRRAFG